MLKIRYNYNISKNSYIKVGGNVKLFIETDELEVVKKILKITKKIKYIGNCSNIFFSFLNSEYIFIKYINREILLSDNLILGSSVSVKYIGRYFSKLGIKGFEKLSGIPCFIGGGIVNNISCFDQYISTNLLKVKVLDLYGKVKEIFKKDIIFTHHYSSLRKCNILLINSTFEKFLEREDELINGMNLSEILRKKSQPINKLTLGSTFKKNDFVSIPMLIEYLNLKGSSIGKSKVSKIHSNFIEIGNNEKIENIISLIELVNRLLYNKLGYYIQLEIEQLKR